MRSVVSNQESHLLSTMPMAATSSTLAAKKREPPVRTEASGHGCRSVSTRYKRMDLSSILETIEVPAEMAVAFTSIRSFLLDDVD